MDRLVSEDRRDHRKYILFYKQLVAPDKSNMIANTLARIHGLLSFSKSIFSSRAVAETFLYFCLHGAATAWILQNELDMPEATAYRALKRLRSLGVIEPATRIAKLRDSKGGPRPVVWTLFDCANQDVAKAIRLHHALLSPKYRLARQVAQTIMDDYLAPRQVAEISYREILIRVKELRISFNTPDIADLAARYLGEQGVKVWR